MKTIEQVSEIGIKEGLKEHFGFEKFKENQEQIIHSILDKENTFVLMPTGGGKSLCYQLPALMLPGTAIVVSPLIALMKNQVDSIRAHGAEDQVAHFLNSSLNRTQMKEVKSDIVNGKTKLLFIAPETLNKDENQEFFKEVDISFIAIDEAHCISEWGHDFRPEYRNIKKMVKNIGDNIPIMALTATATPKVQSDIVKNLDMEGVNTFVSSFNRDNLYYEIRPKRSKQECIRNIVQFVKSKKGDSGIIYVQSRKSTEEIAQILRVNGINAAPYHAGLEAKVRSKIQDQFLKEDAEVIVATIAFGMGIDKPDVRFVIHYDIPKSIENYYQETGRAGRDGLPGTCVAYYSYKDIVKLEKFLRDKPVAERELAIQLMEEITAYSETGTCRRKFLLNYFGEQWPEDNCGFCDNCKSDREMVGIKDDLVTAIKAIQELNENYTIKTIVDFVVGSATKQMRDFRFDKNPMFGVGKGKEDIYWHSVIRQGILMGLVYKEIEQYGILKVSDDGKKYLTKPYEVKIRLNHNFENTDGESVIDAGGSGQGAALDDTLLKMLKELRKKEADRLDVMPWIIFMDPSLIDMSTYYPTSKEDMLKISGVSNGKATRFGGPFINLIKEYIQANDIEKPTDFVMRQVANKSKAKVSIIQNVDRKMPLEDIATINKQSMEDLLVEMNNIVTSGTKLDIDYYIEETLDEGVVEEIEEYFEEAESDSIEDAFAELKDEDITYDEIQLVRIKFISEKAI